MSNYRDPVDKFLMLALQVGAIDAGGIAVASLCTNDRIDVLAAALAQRVEELSGLDVEFDHLCGVGNEGAILTTALGLELAELGMEGVAIGNLSGDYFSGNHPKEGSTVLVIAQDAGRAHEAFEFIRESDARVTGIIVLWGDPPAVDVPACALITPQAVQAMAKLLGKIQAEARLFENA